MSADDQTPGSLQAAYSARRTISLFQPDKAMAYADSKGVAQRAPVDEMNLSVFDEDDRVFGKGKVKVYKATGPRSRSIQIAPKM
ncbi:hypothetical protein [Agrobacterium sp. V1]|uniref:hypothetical protein n=1 Tax=Agrobacterium sp. V1 TaxID=3061957 RepID=UPI002672BAC4|nr:hypothetical protein [Agrobacterium sp. V1]MDO3442224.1 hypothetical protein [Agrobacterium sp. V1]